MLGDMNGPTTNYLIIIDDVIERQGLQSLPFVVFRHELPPVGASVRALSGGHSDAPTIGQTWSEADELMARVLVGDMQRRIGGAPVYPLDAATGFEVTSGGTRHGVPGGEDAATPAGGSEGAGGLGDEGHQAAASEDMKKSSGRISTPDALAAWRTMD